MGEGRRITVLVADDEALARRRILELLGPRPDVRVVGECSNGRETLAAVRSLAPDVLFLDVQMPGLDGFDVLARLRPEELPVVIFSTAYDEYALAAFDAHAVDYLLKPYADERLGEALDRARMLLGARRMADVRRRLRSLVGALADSPEDEGKEEVPKGRPGDPYLERFAAPGRKGVSLVDATAVDWIEASGDYATLHVGTRTHLLRTTMAELERSLDPGHFLRIHRSAIVRIDRIERLLTDDHGDYRVVLEEGRELRVGRTYRDTVLRRLGLRR